MSNDLSEEQLVHRFENGIKLARPQQTIGIHHTVADIVNLPFQVYFENREHITLKSNEIYADVCGFESLAECTGEKWFKPFNQKSVMQTITNDKNVINQNKYIIVEESGFRKDGTEVHTLSIRMPWYNNDNKITGLFGFSISLGKAPLAESLLQIANLGLLNSTSKAESVVGAELDNIYLSKRQLDCSRLLMKGMTAKQISTSLHLSTRTIEGYIDTIKAKLECNNRTELILKLSEYLKLKDD